MKPLRSQVSFSRDRNFTFRRRGESFKEKHDDSGAERDKGKDKGSKEKDKDKGRDKDKTKEKDKSKDKGSKDRDREKRGDGGNQLTSALASSLAATLSPFSTFVSARSPRGSRRPSPSPTASRRSSPPSPRSPQVSPDLQPPASLCRTSSCNLPSPRMHPLANACPSPPSSSSSSTSLGHSRAHSFTLPSGPSKFSSASSGVSSSASWPSSPGTSSPSPSPSASSLSLSASSSRSPSSSSVSAEDSQQLNKASGRTGTKPRIKVSKSDDDSGKEVESSGEPKKAKKAQEVAERVQPYRFEEEAWELRHATDTVAKHRKTCQSCKCTRELHDVYHEDWVNVRERLGLGDSLGRSSRERCLQEGYTWVPPGLSSEQIYDYMSCLPGHKVPRLGTPGEKYRERQLMLQLPKQDLALPFTRHVEAQHHTSFKDFVAARNDIALDIGIVKHHIPQDKQCRNCGGLVQAGSVAVVAPRFGEDVAWHPACFTCSTCNEFLVDLVYCVWEDSIQCGRHYAEKLKPRCSACDELIFSGEYTKAMSKDWHSGHFCCWQCDESLTGQRYVLKDDHPYCIKCYEAVFANTCDDCNSIIGIDSKDLSYKEKHWHEKCFLCSKCQLSLVDKQFGSKQDKVYCGPCYDSQFATRCDGCTEIFRAGNKKMEYKNRQWHEKCFCCCVCKTPIGTKSFIPRDQDIYCATCYEEKFATRCIKCNKIITTGGVTYKNEPWHRECFTCTHCNTSLAGQRFTSRDDKPYCAECFGELFAKRCTSCTKPITGIGGTRFISFEDRHWHNDCFICAVCKGSLVGKGFIADGADILCPECAKQKLV